MKIVNEPLLEEIARGQKCEWCGCTFRCLAAHHIHTRGAGRLDIRENLAALCWLCHTYHHNGQEPTTEQLLHVVAKREKTTVDAIRQLVWKLRREEKP